MSLIQAFSAYHYTILANQSAYNMMNLANSRLSMMSGLGYGPNFMGHSLAELSAMDTRYELDMLSNSLQYQYSKAMLANLKKMRDDDKKLNFFA